MRNHTDHDLLAKIAIGVVVSLAVTAALVVLVSLAAATGMDTPEQYAQYAGSIYGDRHPHIVSVTKIPAFEGAPPRDEITIAGRFHHGHWTTQFIQFYADGPEAATPSSSAIGVEIWGVSGFNRRKDCGETPLGFYHRCWYWHDPVPSHHCRQTLNHDVPGCFGPPIRNWFQYLIYRDIPDTLEFGRSRTIRIRLRASFPAGSSKEYVVGYTYRSSLAFQRNALSYAIDTGSTKWGAGSGVVGCAPADYADSRSRDAAGRRAVMERSLVVDLNVNPQNAPDPSLAYGFDYTGRASYILVSQPGVQARRIPLKRNMFVFAFRKGRRLTIRAFTGGHNPVHVFVVHDPYCGP